MELTVQDSSILCSLFVIIILSASSVTGQQKLIFLNNYAYGSVYRYQARCSLPCTGPYPPGQFTTTIVLDKICSNFEAFENFKAAQVTPSAVWYLNNSFSVYSNSQNMCQFDVQFDYTQSPVPSGTCQLGWVTPTTCPGLQDSAGVVMNGWMKCFDVVRQQLDACYNQTIFSQCCSACNDYRKIIPNCPFGDFRPWQCTSLSDEQCYFPSTEQNCCETCNDIAERRFPKIDGCRYGDRDQAFCSEKLESYLCYQNANRCCEACHWMADSSKPDCLYGNRKADSVCSGIATSDCYNATIERDCCGTCADLRNAKYPDCQYGDRNLKCDTIDRKECYLSSTRDTCCETCVALANNNFPECAYGDRRDCSGISVTNCTNKVIQNECCESCKFLQDNKCPVSEPRSCYLKEPRDCYNTLTLAECCYTCLDYYINSSHLNELCRFGNMKDQQCWRVQPYQCYNGKVNNDCCETCYYLAIYEEETCKYGDRSPSKCRTINFHDCYDLSIETECCESCYYYRRSNLPYNCRYGDKENNCSSISPYQCYDSARAAQCCETCTYYDQSADLGQDCRYGDRRYDCHAEKPYICYDPTKRKECCKYCQSLENSDELGCEFGDKNGQCVGLTASDCYTLESTCCATCPLLVKHLNIDNCQYGDRRNCSGISASQCYDTTTAYQCCETCWLLNNNNNNNNVSGCAYGDRATDCMYIQSWNCYTRENDCCATCKVHLSYTTGLSNCKYGDRVDQCSSILPHQCYSNITQYNCCNTCFYKRRSDLPDTCLYGDKVTTCDRVTEQSFECYDIQRRDQCCESCRYVKTDNPNCEYKDKHILCENLASNPRLCYNKTVENLCCYSCPMFRDTTLQGCEYGDSYQYCSSSDCGKYTMQRLQQCCRTCWGFIGSVTGGPTRPTYQSTDLSTDQYSTTTQDGTGNTDQQSGGTTTTISSTTSAKPQTTLKSTTTAKPPTTPKPTTTEPTTSTNRTTQQTTVDHYSSTFTQKPTSVTYRSSAPTSPQITESATSSTMTDIMQRFTDKVAPIVGGVVGGVVLVALIIIAACFIMRRKNNSEKYQQQGPIVSALEGSRPTRDVPSFNNKPTGAHGLGNPGYKSQVQGHPVQNGPPPPNRAPPKRQKSNQDEEVYDYIDDSDVRTVIIEPTAKKPPVPYRESGDGYLEPIGGDHAMYSNPAFDKEDSGKEEHHYHVLQPTAATRDVRQEYMQL